MKNLIMKLFIQEMKSNTIIQIQKNSNIINSFTLMMRKRKMLITRINSIQIKINRLNILNQKMINKYINLKKRVKQ